MLINVTQDHIDRGVRCDCEKCPVAIAILEAVPGCCYADAGEPIVVCHHENGSGEYIVSKMIATDTILSFFARFDSGGFAKPFSFEFPLRGETA